jgi:hypothetical protein
MWYNEVKKYDFSNPRFSMDTGHFSQLVLKDSKRAGFGLAVDSKSQLFYGVANYDPPGNFAGRFRENVSPWTH